MDPFEGFKNQQKQSWAHFAPLEMVTMIPAARLVKFAGVQAGQQVLDVACGTGVAAVTAARLGAKVTALDLTPELLERARHNSRVAEVKVDWHEGDAEKLPFEDGTFDIVISQFGHIFAPRPALALSEMLRVLKTGGTIAFNTWPPDHMIGRLFILTARFMPPPPPGVAPPVQWGDQAIMRERLGSVVSDIVFDNGTMLSSALSPQHYRTFTEQTAGPMIRLVDLLSTTDPSKLASFRSEYDAIVSEYFQDNTLHQGYLMTRAKKN